MNICLPLQAHHSTTSNTKAGETTTAGEGRNINTSTQSCY